MTHFLKLTPEIAKRIWWDGRPRIEYNVLMAPKYFGQRTYARCVQRTNSRCCINNGPVHTFTPAESR